MVTSDHSPLHCRVRTGGAHPAVPYLLAAVLAACGSSTPASPDPPRPGWPSGRLPSYTSPIGAENALPGEWTWGMGADSNGPLQATSIVSRPARATSSR